MGRTTDIEYADSTCNPMMGCDGCELWPRRGALRHRTCYAGRIIDGATRSRGMAGQPGWPKSFTQPALIHAERRIAEALSYQDLNGKSRREKPWLDGAPRIVFLCDMGDAFTESLPVDWLAPDLPRLAASPHVWLLLTKRPRRMVTFSREVGGLPVNVWPGVSVTDEPSTSRVPTLLEVEGGGPKWVSYEPALGWVELAPFLDPKLGVEWVVFGGESGPMARHVAETKLWKWARATRNAARRRGVQFFMKQLGGRRHKRGSMAHFPEDLRVRDLPPIPFTGQLSLLGESA